jgi:hypothetical protein
MKSARWFLLLVCSLGCGDGRRDDGSRRDARVPTGPIAAELVGGWYGSSGSLPGGTLCVAMCSNARLFAGARPCTETTAIDFTRGYYTFDVMEGVAGYTVSAHGVGGGDPLVFTASVSGSAATFTFDPLPPVPFTRVVPVFSLCDDDTIPPR